MDEVKIVPSDGKPVPMPLSRQIYNVVAPLVPPRPVGLDIVGVDVVYGAFNVGGILMNGYVLLITAKGALIGPQYHLTNAHMIPGAVPSKEEAEEMIHVSTSRLRESKAAQSTLTN